MPAASRGQELGTPVGVLLRFPEVGLDLRAPGVPQHRIEAGGVNPGPQAREGGGVDHAGAQPFRGRRDAARAAAIASFTADSPALVIA